MRTDTFSIAGRRDLLQALDLDRAPVREALGRGDEAAAGAAWMRHFRTREMRLPEPGGARDAALAIDAANGCLNGRLGDGYCVYEVPATGVDWHECPLSCLTRFGIFRDLIAAARATGDPRYVRFMADHALAYMREWPFELFAGHSTHEGWRNHYVVAAPWYWCMLPNRLDEWAKAVALMRASPTVTDDELLAMLQRMVLETRFLVPQIQKHVDNEHNSGGYMIMVLALLSVVLGDLREAREWGAHAARLLAQYVRTAFYPDGLNKELTTAYGGAIVLEATETALVLIDHPEVTPCRDRLRSMIAALIGLSKPTGHLPSFGDLYAGELSSFLLAPLIERLDMPWAKSFAESGRGTPPFLNWPEAGREVYGGYYAMRSDWSRDARYLAIDGGPWGTSHQHGDKLSFVLTAHGHDFITDPSSTLYANNEPGAMISIMNAGFLHNGITVDGVDEFIKGKDDLASRAPLANRWETGARHTLFVSSYDLAPLKRCRWERRVLFVDGAYWILQDVLTGEEPAPLIEQNFQFEENIAVEIEEGMITAAAGDGARLLIEVLDSPLRPALTIGDRTPRTTYSDQSYAPAEPQPPRPLPFPYGRGWVARFTNTLYPAPAVTFSGRVKLPCMITLALIPLRPGDGNATRPRVTRVLRGDATTWSAPLTGGGALAWETGLERCGVD